MTPTLIGGQVIAGSGLDAPLLFSGTPVDGTSGTYAGVAAIGATLIDIATGIRYKNNNTQASPSWVQVGASEGDLPFVIGMPFTLGDRGGALSDGVMIGTITHGPLTDCNVEDGSGATFTDELADANDADANDVPLLTPMDTNDAIYFGAASIFSFLKIVLGTSGAGDAVVAETAWEYHNGTAWAALTEVNDLSVALTASAGTYIVSFLPPADWAAIALDGGPSAFTVRLVTSADNVWNTTTPLITQVFAGALAAGDGITMPFAGTVTAVDMLASVASATNDDTELLLVNVTQGTFAQLTWTGADIAHRVTGLTLDVADGDKVAVIVLTEDGTTEFADCSLTLEVG